MALFTPEAVPAWWAGTDDSAVDARGATIAAIPRPKTDSSGITVVQ
jgi:hypothetical protein